MTRHAAAVPVPVPAEGPRAVRAARQSRGGRGTRKERVSGQGPGEPAAGSCGRGPRDRPQAGSRREGGRIEGRRTRAARGQRGARPRGAQDRGRAAEGPRRMAARTHPEKTHFELPYRHHVLGAGPGRGSAASSAPRPACVPPSPRVARPAGGTAAAISGPRRPRSVTCAGGPSRTRGRLTPAPSAPARRPPPCRPAQRHPEMPR
jgi:hypothetical protein